MKINERGFSALEGLLILVIIAAIGGVGLFVYQSKNKTTASLENTAKSQTSPPKSVPKEAPKPSSPTIPSDQYLVIKEWGVKQKFRDGDKLTYEITENKTGEHNQNDNSYEAELSILIKPEYLQDKSCKPGVGIFRSKTKPTVDSTYVGGYYYSSGGAPGACSNNPETNPDDILKVRILKDFGTSSIESI